MQKVSSKKMSHKEAKEYRELVQNAVAYQHKNGKIYGIASPDDVKHTDEPDEPQFITMDPNYLLLAGRWPHGS